MPARQQALADYQNDVSLADTAWMRSYFIVMPCFAS